MNCLIIFPEEYNPESSEAVVRGSRVEKLVKDHELEEGITLKIGVLGGGLGRGEVLSISGEELRFSLDLTELSESLQNTVLIVAVPRPQTVKKVLQYAATVGIAEVHFLKTANTVKSYLQSKSLGPEAVKKELLLGLEQSVSTSLPEVCIHRKFEPFIGEALKGLKDKYQDPLLVFADVTAEAKLNSVNLTGYTQPVFIAVGPEKGWTDYERKCFEKQGFKFITLGRRMLRVEQAISHLNAQIELLRYMEE